MLTDECNMETLRDFIWKSIKNGNDHSKRSLSTTMLCDITTLRRDLRLLRQQLHTLIEKIDSKTVPIGYN